MDLLSLIRRWHFRQGIPIREIRRRTGLSRNTIRKYLRDDAVEPTFSGMLSTVASVAGNSKNPPRSVAIFCFQVL